MRFQSLAGRISTRLTVAAATVALLASLMPVATVLAAKAAIGLEQCRNGAASAENDCLALGGGSGWVNGNVGGSQGHLVEGYSIPYRAIMTDLPTGTSITIVLGYDIKHGGANAIDYLTHYQRLLPHGVFGHPAETVDPWSGVSGLSGTIRSYPIPAPSATNSPVAGQPATSFNALPGAERVMTLNGGTISNVVYISQGDLTASQSETQIAITFTADSATAVLAWGGHIARGDQWNGAAASAISGSPYHMRAKSWNLGSIGNQDRSLSADAVINPPKLIVIKHVINDNGGAAVASDFTMSISGGGDPSSFAGAESPGTTVLFPDNATYNVTESGPGGYTASYSTDCSGSIAADQTKTCTVTNDDNAPNLRLRKAVTKDNGGTALATAWTLAATGAGGSPTNLSGTTPVDGGTGFKADTYTLAESGGPSAFTASLWTCVLTGTSTSVTVASSQVAVGLGQDITCTITNDDNAPSLTLDKIVIKDNGGTAVESDWTLTANGGTAGTLSGAGATGSTDVVSGATFKAGTYSLSESSGPTGYTPSSWSCVKNGATAVTGSSITLALGDTATCTITNDDTKNDPTGNTAMSWVLKDSASFAIRAGASNASSATITFRLYSNATCTTQVGSDIAPTVTLNGTGTAATAATATGITVTFTGTYYWRAFYSGDQYNNTASTACGSEVTTISVP